MSLAPLGPIFFSMSCSFREKMAKNNRVAPAVWEILDQPLKISLSISTLFLLNTCVAVTTAGP